MAGAGYSSSVQDLGPNLSSLYQSFGGISAPAVGNQGVSMTTLIIAGVVLFLLLRR